jgi:isochorismate hydrolase
MLDFVIELLTKKKLLQDKNDKNLAVREDLTWGALLIDMQQNYVKKLKEDDRIKLIQNQKSVIDTFSTLNLPIAVLEFSGHGETLSELQSSVSRVSRFKYFTKIYDDSFTNLNLYPYFKAEHVNALLLMGMNASCCVIKTAVHAKRLGYTIATSIDIVANEPNKPDHCSIHWYQRNGIYKPNYAQLLDVINLHTVKSPIV